MKRFEFECHDIGDKVFCVCRNEETAKCDKCGTAHRCGHMTIQLGVVEDVMWTEKTGVRYWIGLQAVGANNVFEDRESAERRLADLQQNEGSGSWAAKAVSNGKAVEE